MLYACTTFGFVSVFLLWYSSNSRVTGACSVTTDLIMRVNEQQQQRWRGRECYVATARKWLLALKDSAPEHTTHDHG